MVLKFSILSQSTAILAFGWIWPYVTGITLRMFSLLNFKYNVYYVIDLLLAKEICIEAFFPEKLFLLNEATEFYILI